MTARKRPRRPTAQFTREERHLIRTMRIGAKIQAQQKAEEAKAAEAARVFPISRKEMREFLDGVRTCIELAMRGCQTVQAAIEHVGTPEVDGFESVLSRCVHFELDEAWAEIEQMEKRIKDAEPKAVQP